MSQKLANATALYMEGIRDGDVRTAVETYTGDRYTQHSTGVADGVEGFVAFFEPFIERNPDRDIRVIRSVVDGPYVFLHVYQDINNGGARWVTTDLFDTDGDDRIVEHWDVIAPFVDNPGGPGQVDGPTEITDLDRTGANKAVVTSFADDVLVNRQLDRIDEFVDGSLTEHSPNRVGGLADGVVYRNVFRTIGQGNLVVTYSLTEIGGIEHATFDIYRLDGGRIVEHWDNSEPIPDGPQPNRGKF